MVQSRVVAPIRAMSAHRTCTIPIAMVMIMRVLMLIDHGSVHAHDFDSAYYCKLSYYFNYDCNYEHSLDYKVFIILVYSLLHFWNNVPALANRSSVPWWACRLDGAGAVVPMILIFIFSFA